MTLLQSKRYIYQPLLWNDSCRILELEPGFENDELRGQLKHIEDLSTDVKKHDVEVVDMFGFEYDREAFFQRMSFEALSYVWGSPICVSELCTPDGSIGLTSSLDCALRHIRSAPPHCRRIWADGVCINQNDTEERGNQVRLMGKIYSRAERVLIWLGPDKHHEAKEVFRLAMEASQILVRIQSSEMRHAMIQLVDCDWFRRLWVVQEFLLSKSARFHWGVAFCDFDYLQKPLQHVMSTTDFGSARWLALRSFMDPASNLSFTRVLAITRGLQCSSELDRFYAILGLPYDINGKFAEYMAGLEPRYDKSAYQQYFEFANHCLVNGAIEVLLSQVCHSKAIARVPHLPSWMPDWSNSAGFEPLPGCLTEQQCSSRRKTTSAVIFANCGLLVSASLTDDVIEVVGDNLGIGPEAKFDAAISRFWHDHVRSQALTLSRKDYHSYERLFLQALMCTKLGTDVEWPEFLAQLIGPNQSKHCDQDSTNGFESMLASFELSISSDNLFCRSQGASLWMALSERDPDVEFFESRRKSRLPSPQKYWRERKLFKTSNSLLGLGPAMMRRGDGIVWLDQCANPAVIRVHPARGLLFVGFAFMPQGSGLVGQITNLVFV